MNLIKRIIGYFKNLKQGGRLIEPEPERIPFPKDYANYAYEAEALGNDIRRIATECDDKITSIMIEFYPSYTEITIERLKYQNGAYIMGENGNIIHEVSKTRRKLWEQS